ncbi:MAG: hypothetical protein M9894_04930 [Planctomycetes bacterium]|nr:hypothetical protein [Planctomycetota bacterium]
MGLGRNRVEAFTRIRDALYAARQLRIVLECPSCGHPALQTWLEVADGRGSLQIHCTHCGLVDHMSRLVLPPWASDPQP